MANIPGKVKLSISIDTSALDAIDAEATKHGATRSGLINLIVLLWEEARHRREKRKNARSGTGSKQLDR